MDALKIRHIAAPANLILLEDRYRKRKRQFLLFKEKND